jgi:hypothetical protein
MIPHPTLSTASLRLGLAGAALLLLSACGGGDYSGGTVAGGGPGSGSGSGSGNSMTPEQFFAASVQPRLDFCRSCHVPGGVADTDAGRRFVLSSNPAEDYVNLRAAWERLGRGVEGNRILTKGSNTDPEPHSGGAPWPKGGDAYNDMRLLLACWDNPAACVLSGGGTPLPELPLLGGMRGGHYWFDYCEGKPDDTELPDDPRLLVVPGVNVGKAVYMNAHWQTCQADNKPEDCGELRARVARGYPLVAAAGQVGAGTFFSGNSHESSYAFPASDYNRLWDVVMQLPSRPDNFDELIAERWGMPLSPTRNPYPLPGEDPTADKDCDGDGPLQQAKGGCGQLPMGLTQLRRPDGSWTGNLNVTCSICHGGAVGDATDGQGLGAMYGNNSLSDITVMFTDLAMLAPQQGALAAVSQNKVRGTGNITNFQLFGTLVLSEYFTDPVQLANYLSIQAEASTGTEDPPVWWNGGHRTMKFFDAGQVWDSKRIELSFHFPGVPNHGFPGPSTMADDKQWILDHQQDGDAWILSLKSPAWPENKLGGIDTALAEQGAILFHSKDLWAPQLNNPVPKPDGGNGSCASCHGAYSPRYVNDPAYLDSPLLEGIAAHIVPIEIIGTDSRRLDGNSQRVAEAARNNWFAYNDGPKNAAGIPLCADWNDTALRGERKLGYLAPPLYGVWATAPYFHNGAVPNVWEVLKPVDRQPIWRRLSKPVDPDLGGQVVMGFDYSLEAGYDKGKLGWKYETLACGTGSMPFIDCNPADDDGATLQDGLSLLWAHGGLAWNLLNLPIMSNSDVEARKVYNTHYYSQGNAGHAFTSVLTDQERLAIIEYLKTL